MKTALDSPFLDAETGIGEADDEADAPWRTLRPESPYVQGEIEAREALIEEEKGVIDGDDRRQVANPLAVPFRWICSIAVARRITRASGGTSRTGLAPAGSGVLISSRHVLTAAHLLHGVKRDSSGGVAERHEAQTVRVKFGRSGNDALVEVEANRWDWPRQWKPESGSSAYDFALITLKNPVGEQAFKALGNQALSHWGGAPDTSLDPLPSALASRLLRARVFTAGYPDSSKGVMACAAGVLSTGSAAHDRLRRTPALIEQWARNGTLFSMTADTTEGQSGSPVWVVDQGRRFIVGIAVTAGDTFNQVRGIDAFVLRCLDGWMGTAGTSRELGEDETDATGYEADERRTLPGGAPYRDSPARGSDEWERAPGPDFGNAEEGHFEMDREQRSRRRRDDDETQDLETFDHLESGDDASYEDHERDAPFVGDFAPDFEAEGDVFEHDKSEVDRLLDARDWRGAVRAAIAAGERDESKLTNLVFFARHTDLDSTRPLNPKASQADAKLAREWSDLHIKEVWPEVVAAARDPVLAVHGDQIAGRLKPFRGAAGKRFEQLVETAAQTVGLNAGLIAAALIGETGSAAAYLRSGKVDSYLVGVDDFFALRGVLAKNVPAYAQIRWDKKQNPEVHLNDARKKKREVQTIFFDSGADALLATAVYLKYAEVRLRDDAGKLGGDFDALPIETRFALIRMSMAAGRAGAAKRLAKALKGKDILVRDWTPPKIYKTDRNATVRAAEALFLSGWVFGQPLTATPVAQPERESFAGRDDDEFEDAEFDDAASESDESGGDEFKDYAESPDAMSDTADTERDDQAGSFGFDTPDDEANDGPLLRELDPALVDLAERTMAREVPFEQQVAVKWTTCLSAADIAKVKKVYEDNATAAGADSGDRCSCIVMLNVGLGQLLSLGLKEHRARSTSERRVQMAKLTTETIEQAMAQLRRKGYAVGPTRMNFLDRGMRTAGTLKPERLKASVQERVLADAKKEGCWFAFGLSIMDGYHSVLLLVDRSSADAKIYWLDQFSAGLDDDVTASLDQRLTDKTQAFWQGVMDSKRKGYDTTIRLWQLRKPRKSG